MNRRPPPIPPRPELTRRPAGAFGWLDAALLHDGWLAEAGPHAAAVLVLLALAADQRGASYFGRSRMAEMLGMSCHEVEAALQRLVDLDLVAFRPWSNGSADGVWQLLPAPARQLQGRSGQPLSVADLLRTFGLPQR
jgi:hypothetical protein